MSHLLPILPVRDDYTEQNGVHPQTCYIAVETQLEHPDTEYLREYLHKVS